MIGVHTTLMRTNNSFPTGANYRLSTDLAQLFSIPFRLCTGTTYCSALTT
jgi:hypothetical protein